MGLLGATLKGYGCAGMNTVAYGLCMQELERGDCGIRSFASVQSSLVMYPIHAFGSEDAEGHGSCRSWQQAELIGCFGLTEPDFGSQPGRDEDPRRPKKGDRWVLNGTKMWITNSPARPRRRGLGQGRRRWSTASSSSAG